MKLVQVIGIEGIPEVRPGDDVTELICEAVEEQGISFEDGDILVVTHKIISKAEGRIIHLKDVKPSPFAKRIAKYSGRRAEQVEVVLREARYIVRMRNGHIITRTRQGWICANSGVDISNVSGGDSLVLLPKNPDRSARRIREDIKRRTGKEVAVIISDTSGRPLRRGQIDVAIGAAGIDPLLDLRDEEDYYGYKLRVKQVALIDELASAAELVIGQAKERIPAAIIRGVHYIKNDKARARKLLRPSGRELFL